MAKGAAGDGGQRRGHLGLAERHQAGAGPAEDRGVILTVINGPDGATMDYTRKYTGPSKNWPGL